MSEKWEGPSDLDFSKKRHPDSEGKIDRILTWAEDHPKFDTSFVNSVDQYNNNHGGITAAQETALDNIIEKWRIE